MLFVPSLPGQVTAQRDFPAVQDKSAELAVWGTVWSVSLVPVGSDLRISASFQGRHPMRMERKCNLASRFEEF
jgi:hypothetical protein